MQVKLYYYLFYIRKNKLIYKSIINIKKNKIK